MRGMSIASSPSSRRQSARSPLSAYSEALYSSRTHSATFPAKSARPFQPVPSSRLPTNTKSPICLSVSWQLPVTKQSKAAWTPGVGDVAPQGKRRLSSPARAAYSHSASVGSRPPSQMQKAYASYQLTVHRLLIAARRARCPYSSATLGKQPSPRRVATFVS